MTTTSAIPITVDGTRLDTLAWNVETLDGRLRLPGFRGANPIVPGRDGEIPVLNRAMEANEITLKMWVRGADVDGAIPGGSSKMAEFRKNLEALSLLFTKPHALLDVRQTWPDKTVQYMCQRMEAFDLSASALNPKAGFAVVLRIPGVYGQDVNTSDYTSAANLTDNTTLTLATYNGSTAKIDDSIIVVNGPATNPRLTNPQTGEWVQLSAAIATGTNWYINNGTWDTRTGSGFNLSTSGGGTNQVANTTYAGGGNRFMTLSARTGGPQLVLTGSGFGATTQVLARGRKKYLL